MTLVLILFFIFLLTGMPVALPSASLALRFSAGSYLPLTMPVQLILSETRLAPLAIPMFVFAGNLMNERATKGAGIRF